jgi:glycine/D-amino acid oxidase-like deaminating enzyme
MHAPDIVVVGGGLIGVLTAVELADRGAQVLILEKDDLGFEQSGRSVAAINLPGGNPNLPGANPNGGTRSMLRLSAEQWSGFEERWDCRIDLNDQGWYIVVADAEDEAWLEIERSTWQNTAGFNESKMLDADAAREQFPQFQGPFLALDARQGGHVDAVMVMNGLRQVASRLGVEIRCGTMTTGFHKNREAITAVKTKAGSLECGAVVVAAGLWSPYLCDQLGLHIPMQRVRAPAVETGPLPPNTIPGFLRAAAFGARQNRNGTIRITGGYRFSAMLHDLSLNDLRDLRIWAPALWQNRKDISFRLDAAGLRTELTCAFARLRSPDGQTIVPQGHEPPSNPRDRYSQLRTLSDLIPAIRGARVHRSFSGVMDLTPDLQPVIGRIPGTDNAYVATGFSGHGYMYGPGACAALSQLIVEGNPSVDLESYRPERLKTKMKMREQIF